MEKHTESMMDYCEFFDTEEGSVATAVKLIADYIAKDPACCVIVDDPDDNYALVDLETAKDLLDFGEKSLLPCLIVTE
jgi:hypothetical protein